MGDGGWNIPEKSLLPVKGRGSEKSSGEDEGAREKHSTHE